MMMGARAVACDAVGQGFDAGVSEKVAAQKEGLRMRIYEHQSSIIDMVIGCEKVADGCVMPGTCCSWRQNSSARRHNVL